MPGLPPLKGLDPHPIHRDLDVDEFDVCIAGSGPIGAFIARQLIDAGHSVLIIEIGDQDTRVAGAHKKIEIEFQKNIDRFVRVIQGALSPASIPVSSTIIPELDPSAWRPANPSQQILTHGRNPSQLAHNNLGAQAVTRGVGGMSTHWTCATPEFLRRNPDTGDVFERPVIFHNHKKDDAEWDLLYGASRTAIGTSEKEFEHSIRHNVVLETLQDHYRNCGVKPLPLACHRLENDSPYVQWHATDNVFGDLFDPDRPDRRTKKNGNGVVRGKYTLLTNTRCTRLHLREDSTKVPSIWLAEVRDLLRARNAGNSSNPSPGADFYIAAKTFVIASGAVATPQDTRLIGTIWILANSTDLRDNAFGGRRTQKHNPLIPNLGLYITEQPMAFCQVILHQRLVEDAGNLEEKPEWWQRAVQAHRQSYPDDPLPFPFQDGEPQVTIPASYRRPWHTQIHRDAFSYGEAGPRADPRVVVDLRFFGRQEGVKSNGIVFEDNLVDAYGMPQPTFEYEPTPKYAKECSDMMNDMTDVANKLGGYLPGSSPQFMTPGLALHLGGSTRVGERSDDSVANYNSQVWTFNNLYEGGNGLIPTAFGANPTLTSMCLAIRAAHKIHQDLTKNSFKPPVSGKILQETPADWVKWLTDPKDPNYPNHRELRAPHGRL